MTISRSLPLMLAVLLCAQVPVAAADGVDSHLDAHVVTIADDGSERFAPAVRVAPGDIVEYRIVYANRGEAPVRDLRVSAPVPPGSHYVEGSARAEVPSRLLFSADGGRSWWSPPLRRARDGGGDEAVPPSEYTGLQWQPQVSLHAAEPQTYIYRVRVRDAGYTP